HGILKTIPTLKNRKIWLADSFDGFSSPIMKQDKVTAMFPVNIWDNVPFIKVSQERVESNLKWLNLQDKSRLILVKGYFNVTLPIVKKRIKSISLLRMDGDMYEST